jgi:hypothetical protein
MRRKPSQVAMSVAVVLLVTGLFAVLPFMSVLPRFIGGLTAGAVLAGGFAWVLWLRLISDGSITWRVGALGESWTCDELRKLGPLPCHRKHLREVSTVPPPLEC